MGLRPQRREVVRHTGPALAIAVLLVTLRPALGQEALRVCLDENIPLYSVHRDNTSSGFDLAVADAVARRLGRILQVQWFESKLDEESSSALQANALLSDGKCDLLGGYALVKDALGKPVAETSRLPDHDGASPADRRRPVMLGALVASRPYHYAALTVVLGASAALRPVAGLADLDGLRIGVERGTLADAALMLFDGGRLIRWITHVVPGRGELVPRLEAADYDAILVELRRFDAYRAANPKTRLAASGYYYRIGFNMGFVGLSTRLALIGRVNQMIEAMLHDGELSSLARSAGLTYLPPREPAILENLSLNELRN
jgi:ABC-type amino acid transport substrate-binding protein